jgi:hypothetical protein
VHPPVHPAERHNPEQPFSTPELVSITNLFVVPFSGVAASSISNSSLITGHGEMDWTQLYVTIFVSYLREVDGILLVLWFPPSIYL